MPLLCNKLFLKACHKITVLVRAELETKLSNTRTCISQSFCCFCTFSITLTAMVMKCTHLTWRSRQSTVRMHIWWESWLNQCSIAKLHSEWLEMRMCLKNDQHFTAQMPTCLAVGLTVTHGQICKHQKSITHKQRESTQTPSMPDPGIVPGTFVLSGDCAVRWLC